MHTIEVLTAILTFLTGVYAWLTSRILRTNEAVVRAMREERLATMRPYVTIGPRTVPGSYQVFLRIENTGRTAAQNVRLSLDRPFQRFGEAGEENNLQRLAAFTERLDSLPPGMTLTFTLAMATQLFGPAQAPADAIPRQFRVRVEYSWPDGNADETSFVDLRPYAMTTVEQNQVVGELEKIRKEIAALRKKE